ncbi:dehydrogenase [Amycolatopsis deserti]|uniref:Dehydrogenase n=1 Tax=Amycolatopsis deserti TaxID=185696 RepID=A0ABQ3IUW1_9PSEU|nr:NAD(P)-dependent oxidoreductase [Amycolatopsis deserti]GHE92706.1 dehydrogenase [Amycolatopsis deserti]
MSDRPAVAVLGTGTIGAPVARNLATAGYPVRVWNRTAARAEAAVAGTGATVCASPAEAVRGAGIVVTVMTDAVVTAQVIAEAAEFTEGAVWVQLGTVGTGIDDLRVLAEKSGLVLVDAPVQGTRQPAEQGTLVVMAAAEPAVRPTVEPLFDVLGSRTLWVSDSPGAASRLKLALNVWVAALTHGVAESLAVAQALGLDPALVVDVVTGGPMDSGFFQGKSAAALKGDFTPSFTVTNSIKDAELVLAAAGGSVPLTLTAAALDRWRLAQAQGHGGKDMIASYLAEPERN